ncbi:transcriptional regulator [Leptolyngbya sp. Heron Island J]|uniref:ArsR/SmtB family transcription factor n=1 Tax=Leptolyngbya sp. Heron Island J TaxID=1385935 RepID=UPI0003B9A01A|nr:metalloregulator ArsR/SmtB family transcription factor [Leptolyngbya sp. Heron Island J]ESA33169.1 transcriptional regulator [Leptolyngbya sp. Heron Island J]
MRPIFHPDTTQITLADVLYALGDPVRLKIVKTIAQKGEQACRSCGGDDIAKSTLSHHFKILREAGIVHTQKVGTQHLNSLRLDELEARFPGVLPSVLAAATDIEVCDE